MPVKTTIEDGYRIVLPEPLRGQFRVGAEIFIEQDPEGRLVISTAPDEEILTYLLSGEESLFGRQLRELRQEIINSGAPLLDWDELERDLAERRGE